MKFFPLKYFACCTLLVGGSSLVVAAGPAPAGPLLFEETFSVPNGLVSNEYAIENPADAKAFRSSKWEVTSGSLFVKDGAGYTGVPDRLAPNVDSSNGNDSAVFRCRTKESTFGDVEMALKVFNLGFVETERTPEKAFDGIHLWLRYVSDKQLYSITINRRDNIAVIKKKLPGGPSNGGTYTTLKSAKYEFPFNQWQNFEAVSKNNADGSVTVSLLSGGKPVVSAVDAGKNGPAITEAGHVGVRGDNCQFLFDDVRVRALAE